MANDPDKPTTPEEELFQARLSSKWDPAKMSQFLRGSKSSKGQRLDVSTRARYEQRLGVDLGGVRIFSGALAEEITKAHSAEALTVGDTGIILMRGSSAFNPFSAAGQALLAHELTHVAQANVSALSRKAVSSAPLATEQSEEEAEEVEQEVMQQIQGGGAPSGGGKDSGKDKDKKDKLKEAVIEKVLQLYEEDMWNQQQRWGHSARMRFVDDFHPARRV